MPTVERIDHADLTTTVSVHVPKTEIAPVIKKELNKLQKSVAMKGFRPGQTPLPLVKKMYGSRLLAETLNEMTVGELQKHIDEAKLDIIFAPIPSEKESRHRFDINELEDYTFHFDLARQPEFELKGLSKEDTYEKLVPSDLADLIDMEIKAATRRHGERLNPTDGIADEDVVKIAAVELNDDGSPKEGGVVTTMSAYIPNITSQPLRTLLSDMKTGDTFHFDPRELDTFTNEKLYRKYILNLADGDGREVGHYFEGRIEEVSRLTPAEVNQELYDKHFGPGTVSSDEEARGMFGVNLIRHFNTQAEALLLRDMQDRVLDLTEIGLPANFIKRYLLLNQREGNEVSPERIDASMPGLLRTFSWDLIRSRIEGEAGIEVMEEEIKQAFIKRVHGYFQGQTAHLPEDFVENTAARLMADKEQRKDVRDNILYDKLFTEMAARVTIVERPVPSAEISERIKLANQSAGASNDDILDIEGGDDFED